MKFTFQLADQMWPKDNLFLPFSQIQILFSKFSTMWGKNWNFSIFWMVPDSVLTKIWYQKKYQIWYHQKKLVLDLVYENLISEKSFRFGFSTLFFILWKLEKIVRFTHILALWHCSDSLFSADSSLKQGVNEYQREKQF